MATTADTTTLGEQGARERTLNEFSRRVAGVRAFITALGADSHAEVDTRLAQDFENVVVGVTGRMLAELSAEDQLGPNMDTLVAPHRTKETSASMVRQVRYTPEKVPEIAEGFASLQPEVAITGVETAGDVLSRGIQVLTREISGVQWEVFLKKEIFAGWDYNQSSKDPIEASRAVSVVSDLLDRIGTTELTRENVTDLANEILSGDSPHKVILMKALTLKAFIAGGYRVDIELPDENGTFRPWGGPDGRNELTEAVQSSLREHGRLDLLSKSSIEQNAKENGLPVIDDQVLRFLMPYANLTSAIAAEMIHDFQIAYERLPGYTPIQNLTIESFRATFGSIFKLNAEELGISGNIYDKRSDFARTMYGGEYQPNPSTHGQQTTYAFTENGIIRLHDYIEKERIIDPRLALDRSIDLGGHDAVKIKNIVQETIVLPTLRAAESGMSAQMDREEAQLEIQFELAKLLKSIIDKYSDTKMRFPRVQELLPIFTDSAALAEHDLTLEMIADFANTYQATQQEQWSVVDGLNEPDNKVNLLTRLQALFGNESAQRRVAQRNKLRDRLERLNERFAFLSVLADDINSRQPAGHVIPEIIDHEIARAYASNKQPDFAIYFDQNAVKREGPGVVESIQSLRNNLYTLRNARQSLNALIGS